MQRGPDVLGDADALIGAPEEATAEEGGEEEETVVPLRAGASHVEFVEEPVEVEKGGGELVEDEGWAVEVYEGPLVEYCQPLGPMCSSTIRGEKDSAG